MRRLEGLFSANHTAKLDCAANPSDISPHEIRRMAVYKLSFLIFILKNSSFLPFLRATKLYKKSNKAHPIRNSKARQTTGLPGFFLSGWKTGKVVPTGIEPVSKV